MKLPRTAFWVYLLGVMLLGAFLGAFESRFRAALGDWLSFALVITYLIGLRVMGEFIERKRNI
jgi:putative Mn2+ efflux pump MntP